MKRVAVGLDRLHANDISKQDLRTEALNISSLITVYAAIEAVLSFSIGLSANIIYDNYFLGWHQPWLEMLVAPGVVSAGLIGASLIREHHHNLPARTLASVTWSGLTASLRAFALLIAALFILKMSDDLSRGGIICQFFAVTAAIMWARAVFYRWVCQGIASGRVVTGRLLILGDGARLVKLLAERRFGERLRGEGKSLVRVLSWDSMDRGSSERQFIADVIHHCRAHAVDSVVVVPSAEHALLTERVTAAFAEMPVTVHILPFAGLGDATPGVTQIGGQASLSVVNTPLSNLGKVAKRLLDVCVAAALLAALLPLLVIVAAAIKFDSAGPVFFRQGRHGYGNRPIRVFKFRSMRVLEDGGAFRQATRNDARITRVGRFIRRTNIDELPQLLNVLLGDMSLVGPRPHPIALNDDFAGRIDLFHRRHNILPGITGWAQVNGYRGETDTDEKMRRRIDHDLWYIDNWSLGLDLRILILTLFSATAYRNAG